MNIPLDPQHAVTAQLATQLADLVMEQARAQGMKLQLPDYAKEFGEAMNPENEVIHEPLVSPPYPSGLVQYFYKVLTNLDKVESPKDLSHLQAMVRDVEKVATSHALHSQTRQVSVQLDPKMFPDTKVALIIGKEGIQAQLQTQSAQVEAFCQRNLSTLRGLFSANRIDFKIQPIKKVDELNIVYPRRRNDDDRHKES